MRKKSTSRILDDAPITQADVDAGKLVPVKRVAGRIAQVKQLVTLYLDAAIVERFKQQAGERGYQTLINETLRKVIRYEFQKENRLTASSCA
jgi:uncharacterized protein (DUF4415 family)